MAKLQGRHKPLRIRQRNASPLGESMRAEPAHHGHATGAIENALGSGERTIQEHRKQSRVVVGRRAVGVVQVNL
jgi:hypothetical protein